MNRALNSPKYVGIIASSEDAEKKECKKLGSRFEDDVYFCAQTYEAGSSDLAGTAGFNGAHARIDGCRVYGFVDTCGVCCCTPHLPRRPMVTPWIDDAHAPVRV